MIAVAVILLILIGILYHRIERIERFAGVQPFSIREIKLRNPFEPLVVDEEEEEEATIGFKQGDTDDSN